MVDVVHMVYVKEMKIKCEKIALPRGIPCHPNSFMYTCLLFHKAMYTVNCLRLKNHILITAFLWQIC